jgi:hypothetical protein
MGNNIGFHPRSFPEPEPATPPALLRVSDIDCKNRQTLHQIIMELTGYNGCAPPPDCESISREQVQISFTLFRISHFFERPHPPACGRSHWQHLRDKLEAHQGRFRPGSLCAYDSKA